MQRYYLLITKLLVILCLNHKTFKKNKRKRRGVYDDD